MREPTLIAFDTSAAHCAAAVLCDGRLTTRVDTMTKGQAEHLMPMLEEMLAAAGLVWSDLDRIGVGTGPGNFTGIRISVAAARGLALGLGIPAIGVSGFDVLADGLPRPVSAIVSAPRDMAYVQTFKANGAAPAELMSAQEASRLAGSAAPALIPAESIARIARIAAAALPPFARPAPLYVRGADAAPARDAPPLILP